MRQRITFIQEAEDSTNPESLKVTTDSIVSTTNVKGGREDRITFGFDELPQELYKVLKASHEIHVRWIGEKPYDGVGPLVGRMSPGLHVFYTQQRGKGNKSDDLCPLLRRVFGDLDCISPEKSFTNLPTERFSHSAATQYYTPLPSLNSLITYLSHRLCVSPSTRDYCLSRISLLNSASTLDIDFDTISHAVTLTAFFPTRSWPIKLTSLNPKSRLEVGILSVSKPTEPEELSLGGFLTVIGEHTKPSPTLFSFPSRHHPTDQDFTSSLILPTGLHPTLELAINGNEPPTDERTCTLHTHLTLPRQIFADKYQLSDPLFLASKNLSAIHYTTNPVDLEAPSYTVPLWGSSLLLELSPPTSSSKSKPKWTAQIPLHLRYLPPSQNSSGLTSLSIPYPVVFWACTADEGSKFPINPFDKVNLGYDGLFGPRTMFYHLSPKIAVGGGDGGEGRLVNTLNVPVLDLDRSWYVEGGTAVAVVLGFAWVVWCLGGVWWRVGYGKNKVAIKGEGEKKKL